MDSVKHIWTDTSIIHLGSDSSKPIHVQFWILINDYYISNVCYAKMLQN